MTADLHARLLAELDAMTTAMADDRYPMLPPVAALRAVVERHAPFGETSGPYCSACSKTAGNRWVLYADCPDIRTIAEHLGVTEGDPT